MMVIFCKKCVMSSERPSSVVEHKSKPEDEKPRIQFDEEGVCSACRVAEQKAKIDWAMRERELLDFLDHYRSPAGNPDVVIPGSGGKDSFFAAHILKHKYGMHPITCTWAPALYTEWGWRNFQRFAAIAPNYLLTPPTPVHRLLTRLSLERNLHPFAPFIYGQKAFPAKLATQLGISLVFYGESPGEYGNTGEMDGIYPEKYYIVEDEIRLAGMTLTDISKEYGVGLSDLSCYQPLSINNGLDIRYLGNYLKWKPQEMYYYACEHGGFEAAPERTPGTYSKYNSLDDKLDDLHYWTTYQKFGIGRATYDAAQEIRSGDITREEGIALVRRFDGEYPERFEREVFEYLSVDGFPDMTRERLFMLAEKFRSPHLWDGDTLRHRVWE